MNNLEQYMGWWQEEVPPKDFQDDIAYLMPVFATYITALEGESPKTRRELMTLFLEWMKFNDSK